MALAEGANEIALEVGTAAVEVSGKCPYSGVQERTQAVSDGQVHDRLQLSLTGSSTLGSRRQPSVSLT